MKTNDNLLKYFNSYCVERVSGDKGVERDQIAKLIWFRDNFAEKEDLDYYYRMSPSLIQAIDRLPEANTVYQFFYDEILTNCVEFLKKEEYEQAYKVYLDGFRSLVEKYLK